VTPLTMCLAPHQKYDQFHERNLPCMTLITPDMPSLKTTTKEGDHDFRKPFQRAFHFGNLGEFSHLQSENKKTNVATRTAVMVSLYIRLHIPTNRTLK